MCDLVQQDIAKSSVLFYTGIMMLTHNDKKKKRRDKKRWEKH